MTKQAIKDAYNSYKRFFKGQSKFPRFKGRKKSKPIFYQDTSKIKFTETHIKVEGFSSSKKQNKQKPNWIKLAEKGRITFGDDIKYINPRVTFDGINWWMSLGMEYLYAMDILTNEGIGIDLGIDKLAVCSDMKEPYKI